jgi:hypothetical protein
MKKIKVKGKHQGCECLSCEIKRLNNSKTQTIRKCLCGRKLKPDLSAKNFKTGKWDGHSYKCVCSPKVTISIG